MARRYGYRHAYRGRQGSSPFLRGLVIFLAVLLAVTVALVIWLSRYLQYTDEGTKLDMPWLREQGEPSVPSGLPELVVEDETPPDQQEMDRTDGMETALSVLRALEVESSAFSDGSAAQAAAEAGANALVVRVKDKEGNLAFYTPEELAQESMNGSVSFNLSVGELARVGRFRLIARLSGFQDLWTSVYVRETAITYPRGSLWYDRQGISWMSLSNERARSYLTDLCLALADMGFDEILLEHAGYPDHGRIAEIAVNDNYPGSGREALAGAFLKELSGKLEKSGAVLSVQPYSPEPEENTASGITATALAGISGRVWLPEDADPGLWAGALAAAGMVGAADRLVIYASGESSGAWPGSVLLG